MEIIFKPHPANFQLWEIHVDGEKWREGHRTIFGRKPRFPSVSSEEDLNTIFNEFEYRRVKGYLFWRLAKQSYHSEQLIKLLEKKGVQLQTIDRVIDEFQEKMILDDLDWLEKSLRRELKSSGLRVALSKLRRKGIPVETLQNFAKKWENPQNEVESIRLLLQKRCKTKDLSDPKVKQKVIASILRKGYGYEQVAQAMREIIN